MLHKSQTGVSPAFYDRYIAQLPDTDIWDILEKQPQHYRALLEKVSAEKAETGYAPGKWSPKEVLGHVTDAERVFAYRCLCISRQETQSLPGFDENTYTAAAQFNNRSLANLLEEFTTVRQANLYLFRSLDENRRNRVGIANGEPVSTQALILIAAGHAQHHLHILQERYKL